MSGACWNGGTLSGNNVVSIRNGGRTSGGFGCGIEGAGGGAAGAQATTSAQTTAPDSD